MRWVAVTLALVMSLTATWGRLLLTPIGLQCPTAPIQTITIRDCCGHLVARAPKPGEPGFQQCRCAEKRSTSSVSVPSAPAMVAVLTPVPAAFFFGIRLQESWIPLDPFVYYRDVHPEGPNRPPSA